MALVKMLPVYGFPAAWFVTTTYCTELLILGFADIIPAKLQGSKYCYLAADFSCSDGSAPGGNNAVTWITWLEGVWL